MSLDSDVMEWLANRGDEQPEKGWRSIDWIQENLKKGFSRSQVVRDLEGFVKAKKIPPGRFWRISGRSRKHYYVGK